MAWVELDLLKIEIVDPVIYIRARASDAIRSIEDAARVDRNSKFEFKRETQTVMVISGVFSPLIVIADMIIPWS
eukprot:7448781-Pyramimonas_sp.AAC.1